MDWIKLIVGLVIIGVLLSTFFDIDQIIKNKNLITHNRKQDNGTK